MRICIGMLVFYDASGINCQEFVFPRTVIQMAIFEGMYCCGMFSVNCDIVFSPSIRNPVAATPAYTTVTTMKLKQ
jgi:hypothetical protein